MKKHPEPSDKFKINTLAGVNSVDSTISKNSPLIMPDRCQAQFDIYKKALAEEDDD